MTVEQAKQIQLEDFFLSLGYIPVRQRGNKLWYHSPLHSESTPSFKVNTNRNQWYDFGIGCGGSIIDFAILYYHTNDISQVLKQIERELPTKAMIPKFSYQPLEPSFKNVETKPLIHFALESYIRKRRVDIDICRHHCNETHYSLGDKSYFAIGFPNRSGGSELRNPFFKGCIPPKDITVVRCEKDHNECSIFEGFMDYLSFLTMKKRGYVYDRLSEYQDFFILNSVTNLPKVIPLLEGYVHIYSFLDNDQAGRETHAKLLAAYGDYVVSMSEHFDGFKDVNDHLCWIESKLDLSYE